ncbi:MAG: hypothetical protein K6F95_07005 [Selenomonas sp.]|nr:hypothetical protein [Selenomonas sp.]
MVFVYQPSGPKELVQAAFFMVKQQYYKYNFV